VKGAAGTAEYLRRDRFQGIRGKGSRGVLGRGVRKRDVVGEAVLPPGPPEAVPEIIPRGIKEAGKVLFFIGGHAPIEP
jgi:hypothetical protein